MAKPVAKSSSKDVKKSGKAKDLPAKSLKADQAAAVKGGFALSSTELKIHKHAPTTIKAQSSYLKYTR